jgi:hypothetical protein
MLELAFTVIEAVTLSSIAMLGLNPVINPLNVHVLESLNVITQETAAGAVVALLSKASSSADGKFGS